MVQVRQFSGHLWRFQGGDKGAELAFIKPDAVPVRTDTQFESLNGMVEIHSGAATRASSVSSGAGVAQT